MCWELRACLILTSMFMRIIFRQGQWKHFYSHVFYILIAYRHSLNSMLAYSKIFTWIESSSVASFFVRGGGGKDPQKVPLKKSRTCNLYARASERLFITCDMAFINDSIPTKTLTLKKNLYTCMCERAERGSLGQFFTF